MSYEHVTVKGVTLRQLDRHETSSGIKAAVYVVIADGSGLIIYNGESVTFDSPTSALAEWLRWIEAQMLFS